jgi:hypothetical protein
MKRQLRIVHLRHISNNCNLKCDQGQAINSHSHDFANARRTLSAKTTRNQFNGLLIRVETAQATAINTICATPPANQKQCD